MRASEEEALIRVGAAGICHTDIDILHGHYPARFPLTPGHEFAGVVEAVGRNADESLVGQRVAADPLLPCNLCSPCRARRFNKCESLEAYGATISGGFSEFVVVAIDRLHQIGTLSFEAAALAEPLGCVLHGLNRVGIEKWLTSLSVRGRAHRTINDSGASIQRRGIDHGYRFARDPAGSGKAAWRNRAACQFHENGRR